MCPRLLFFPCLPCFCFPCFTAIFHCHVSLLFPASFKFLPTTYIYFLSYLFSIPIKRITISALQNCWSCCPCRVKRLKTCAKPFQDQGLIIAGSHCKPFERVFPPSHEWMNQLHFCMKIHHAKFSLVCFKASFHFQNIVSLVYGNKKINKSSFLGRDLLYIGVPVQTSFPCCLTSFVLPSEIIPCAFNEIYCSVRFKYQILEI